MSEGESKRATAAASSTAPCEMSSVHVRNKHIHKHLNGGLVLTRGVNAGNTVVERLLGLLGLHSKAFVGAFWIAFSSSLIAFFIRLGASNGVISYLDPDHNNAVVINTAAWSSVMGTMGFLIVFRASQAYGRYWQAMTNVHLMRAEWFDSCSAICSFCSDASDEKTRKRVRHYKQLTVRLFSLLHAGALLRTIEPGIDDEAVRNIVILDPLVLDRTSVEAFFSTGYKVELVSQWIQHLIMAGLREGILSAPPPIVSRSFQELANGVVRYHDALKVKTIMFPVQYSQVCDGLLTIHWAMTPFFMAMWVNSPFIAALLTFLGTFALWALSRVSTRIENPFSLASFIDDTAAMQAELNEQLMLMLNADVSRVPSLPGLSDDDVMEHSFDPVTLSDFCQARNLSDAHVHAPGSPESLLGPAHTLSRATTSVGAGSASTHLARAKSSLKTALSTEEELSKTRKDLQRSQSQVHSNGEPTPSAPSNANPLVRLAEEVERKPTQQPTQQPTLQAAKKECGDIAGEVRREILLGIHSLEATAAETIQDVVDLEQDVAKTFEPITSTIFEGKSDKMWKDEIHTMADFGMARPEDDVQGMGGADLAKDSERLPGRSSGDTSGGASSVPADDSQSVSI